MYLKRLTSSGMSGNKYWYDKTMNHGAGTANGLPNCTCYAVGRFYEECNAAEPFTMFKNQFTPGGFPTAKDFISYTVLPHGTVPRLGAIAVWGKSSDKTGHVAIVEGFNGNTITVSQSNYGGTYFEVKKYICEVGKVTPGVGYLFQGYIYNPYIKDNRVKRNKDKAQVDILAEALNVRKTPNGDKRSGCYATKGLYNVLDIVDAGGYRWLKVDEDCWVAQNDDEGWTCFYDKESDSVVKDLELKCSVLQDEVANLTRQLEEKTKEAEEIRNELTGTAERLNSALAENRLVSTELDMAHKTITDAIEVLRR